MKSRPNLCRQSPPCCPMGAAGRIAATRLASVGALVLGEPGAPPQAYSRNPPAHQRKRLALHFDSRASLRRACAILQLARPHRRPRA